MANHSKNGACVWVRTKLAHQKVHAHLLRLGHVEEVSQLAAWHFDHANDARRDFGYAQAARVTGGEEDLDGLGEGGALHWRASANGPPEHWVQLEG